MAVLGGSLGRVNRKETAAAVRSKAATALEYLFVTGEDPFARIGQATSARPKTHANESQAVVSWTDAKLRMLKQISLGKDMSDTQFGIR